MDEEGVARVSVGASARPERSGSPLVDWAIDRSHDQAVSQALEEWTGACISASRIAWALDLPMGDRLLEYWARGADSTPAPEVAFSTWLVGQLGRSGRAGLSERGVAERRGPVIRAVHRAAARVIETLWPEAELTLEPPAGVGPRHRERWLVDDGLAASLGNTPVSGVVHPVVVLRPLLERDGQVLVEGEVA